MKGKRFGQRLRALRRKRGLSQSALARRVGIHRVTIANLENGRYGTSGPTLAAMSRALGVRMSVLLGERP